MYPNPYIICANKKILEKNYIHQVNSLNEKGLNKILLNKNQNIFRFCSYNVKHFNFKKDANKLINNFIKEFNIDAISLIEYNQLQDDYIKNESQSIFFEQLYNYGISTHYNFENNLINYDIYGEVQKINGIENIKSYKLNEKRGFTHLIINLFTTNINIITIHLDVTDEEGKSRFFEINEIYKYIRSRNLINVLVIGDFNEWDIRHNEPLYEPILMEFQERTGKEHFSTKVHDFLHNKNFVNVFDLLTKRPKFSCWSAKLVDFCYKFNPTWNKSIKINNIDFAYFDYSDHLPIILDIEI